VDEIDFPPDIVIRKIATGKHHVLALDSNGKVWTWGKNDKCQLGYSD
jgi:alpha-tubulin suppressor-like RCC1 family protein